MATMHLAKEDDGKSEDPIKLLTTGRDLQTQASISIVLGLFAFLLFCFLRTRWPALYAARKKQKNEAHILPQLPDTFFGWMPVLYRITDEEVLASAGLDAFVFLAFFKMAIKYLAFLLFFSLTVTYPIHQTIGAESGKGADGSTESLHGALLTRAGHTTNDTNDDPDQFEFSNDYLWIYVVFVWVYSLVAIYFIVTETSRVIRVRQRYLGVQSSVTDRTIRLSGIPPELRDEKKIKETIENLEIGKVESVTLCKNWKKLDDLVSERTVVLRKLEQAWTVHLGFKMDMREPLQRRVPDRPTEDSENDALLENGGYEASARERDHIMGIEKPRPTARIWHGFLGLESRKVDAIEHYEKRLRELDGQIQTARETDYAPMPMAFVTLDSIAACQMAIQAILDPKPMQLMANPSPAPADVVWRNTYLPRRQRMFRAWSITFLVLVLTIFWFSLLSPFAASINLANLYKVFPPLQDILEAHPGLKPLVRTSLPTVAMSLLNFLVPYIYDYLSNLQGMTSQGDVELSVISKNFFFTFFTLFVAFTLVGTAATAFGPGKLGDQFRDRLGDVLGTAQALAKGLETVGPLYMNLIVLQAFGIFPFRLLEFGAVFMYPIGLMGAKTPRDYAELVQPPVFSYGFFLPQTIFIFVICIIYSILPSSERLVLFGLVYFLVGNFIYKYQLLYAMDHRNFSTGRAWPMICNRITVGLIFFQIAMGGQLVLSGAWRRSLLVVPLFIGTIWFAVFYGRTFEPLTKFIALRSLHETHDEAMSLSGSRYEERSSQRAARTEDDLSTKFINPSLVVHLEDVWIAKANARSALQQADGG